MKNSIFVKGAAEHNLKNIDVRIPRDKMIVITGLSGSGKSSLAFDTIYAEGQRRYVESLSSYARQFLGQMEKPDVEYIEGLSPAISIDQKTTSKNPRSTVGTVTEIYDYMRLLYARAGTPHCPQCGIEITQQSVDQIVDRVMELPQGSKIQILSPVVRQKKGEHKRELEMIKKEGFVRIRVNGEIRDISEEINLSKTHKHVIEIVVDRLVVKPDIIKRLTDSVETALKYGDGLVVINKKGLPESDGEGLGTADEDIIFNTHFSCPEHGKGIAEMEPRMFSFNNPFGACEACKGIGFLQKIDKDLVIPNMSLSLDKGGIVPVPGTQEGAYYYQMVEQVLEVNGYSASTPFEELPEEVFREICYGTSKKIEFSFNSRFGGNKKYTGTFEGILNNLERRYNETSSEFMHDKIEEFMSLTPCKKCMGKRLRDEVLAVKFGGINIHEMTEKSVQGLMDFLSNLELSDMKSKIAEQILREIRGRLEFLKNVGLDYLTLDRASGTLSGGESQRIRLATQIGSGLVGVLYILDEPSIGLHQKDNSKLIAALRNLTDIGNTLIIVEHDDETILSADYVVDMGPGAGEHGGYVVAQGTPKEIINNKDSITGQYLSGEKKIEVPSVRRKSTVEGITIWGASENNLRGIDVTIPVGVFTSITGVSGSGKSTLINEILYKAVTRKVNKTRVKPGKHDRITGLEAIDKVIEIDQSPIGRTPRSNPATYTGLFDPIRDLFAATQESKMRGYQKGRFSFNVKGGRCEACKGDGIIKIEMHFLPDVYVACDVCNGKRYNRETLEVKYKGKNISDILEMTVEEALSFFENHQSINRKLQTLHDVGLGYIRLGQPSTQLSGGEAQRVKLATELSKRSTGKTLYVLDEPTTGLHTADVHNLIKVIDRLADGGNTVVIIEHNLDVIKSSDYVIDLGPDGGNRGGSIVAMGTPEEVAEIKGSYTGEYLKKALSKEG